MKCFYQNQGCMAGQHAPGHGNTQLALGEVTCSGPCTETEEDQMSDSAGVTTDSLHYQRSTSCSLAQLVSGFGISMMEQITVLPRPPSVLGLGKNRMRQTRLALPTFHVQLGQGLVASSEQWAKSGSIGATYRLRWFEPVCCHHISFNLRCQHVSDSVAPRQSWLPNLPWPLPDQKINLCCFRSFKVEGLSVAVASVNWHTLKTG